MLGFTVSALLHFGAVSAILWAGKTHKVSFSAEHQVAVSLAMFEGPVGRDPWAADVTRIGEPSANPAPLSRPEPVPESVPAREPEPVQQQQAEPEPERVPEPEPEPELNANPALRSKSEPAPRPEPKAEHKPNSTSKAKSQPRPKPKSAAKPKPSGKTRSRPSHAVEGSGKANARTTSGSAAASAKGGGKRQGPNARALEKQYLAGLQRAIAKKRRYPSHARRRGETGVVRVSFVLAQSGRISGARVDKSSGSGTLDKAALETLKRLGRYKPIPKAIGRTRWRLRVPIRFALK